MAEQLKLRRYQQDCIDAVFAAWRDGMKRPAAVLPTGAGKTVVFSALIQKYLKENTDRVIVLVHRDELADQAINKIRQTAPGIRVGKIKAESDETDKDVMVCSVQTISRDSRLKRIHRDSQFYGSVGLIITDECHHGSAPSYKKIYDEFPDARNVGFTATLARGDGAGLGDVWEDVVYTRSVLNMISNKYLVDVRAKRVDIAGLNFGDVKTSRGDYQVGDLGSALMETDAMDHIAKAYQEHASDRPGVVFTPTVATAIAARDSLDKLGITTAVISGETPREERHRIFDDFRTGKIQVLANCMVLTEGFDAPWASCAVIARPTQSQPLYVQMVGRVLRTWPGKEDALVLDVTGTGGMKLKTLVDLEPGLVTGMKEDESLEEAAERENEEYKEQQRQEGRKGFFHKLHFTEHDLFAASDKHWLRTDKGIMFISAGPGEVFLWPSKDQPGLWDVCFAPKQGKWERKRDGLPLEMAMAWGEADAEDYSEFSVNSSASWRRTKPSQGQLNVARTLGIDGAEHMRKGQLSDLISIKFASRKFDRHV